MKIIKKFILLFAGLLLSQVMNASVINSARSGSWLDGSTWEGGTVPASTDTVNIKNNHVVTYYVDRTSNFTTEICRSLNIATCGSFYASNLKAANLQFNFRGNVVCNGTIDLGQVGTTVSAAIFGFIGSGNNSFSGTGNAYLRVLQHWGDPSTILTVSIANLKLSGGFYEITKNGTIKIENGTTIEPMEGATNLQMTCAGYNITTNNEGGKFEIWGSVSVNNLYLRNKAASGNKSMITIKDGGELTVKNKISTRSPSDNSIGGTGMIFTVEAGGKFNYPGSDNPLDFTNPSHVNYDPNLSVIYKFNSIINSVVTVTVKDIVSSISEIGNEKRFYVSEKQLIIPQTIEEISIYNLQGLCIYRNGNIKGNVDLSAYSGLLIVQVKSDNIKRTYKIAI